MVYHHVAPQAVIVEYICIAALYPLQVCICLTPLCTYDVAFVEYMYLMNICRAERQLWFNPCLTSTS